MRPRVCRSVHSLVLGQFPTLFFLSPNAPLGLISRGVYHAKLGVQGRHRPEERRGCCAANVQLADWGRFGLCFQHSSWLCFGEPAGWRDWSFGKYRFLHSLSRRNIQKFFFI